MIRASFNSALVRSWLNEPLSAPIRKLFEREAFHLTAKEFWDGSIRRTHLR
jgi:hypothetical protein